MVLGINAAYHECSAALAGNGQVWALEEERLTRVKHAKSARVDNPDQLPWQAIDWCLGQAALTGSELTRVIYTLQPGLRRCGDPFPVDADRGWGTPAGEAEFERRLREIPNLFARRYPGAPPVEFLSHHLAHAACAWFSSPFERGALLVVDGIGEQATTWLGRAEGGRLERLEELDYPHSLGMLWERAAVWLGFSEYDAPKVMGLAAYGDPARYRPQLAALLPIEPDGRFRLEGVGLRRAGVEDLEQCFGPSRRPDQEPTQARFADLAAALQERTELVLLALCRRLQALTGETRLAYAGGVALNCVANARLEREGPFEELYIPGAAHDAGTALGAALLGAGQRCQETCLGPEFAEQDLLRALSGVVYSRPLDPAAEGARRLAEGQLLGWFQGRLEFGPRALGNRSLLADPRDPRVRAELNRRVKHREAFRPFAGAILERSLADYFELPPGDRARHCRPLMLLAYPLRAEHHDSLPALVHADGSCRIQTVSEASNPRLARLLEAFAARTGVPVVLNTSFNDSEPIVCRPEEALATFHSSGLDALMLGPFLVERT